MSEKFASAGLTVGQLNAIVKRLGGEEGALKFLRGDIIAYERARTFIVRVDRSVKPSYREGLKKVMHPELELAGPAEYDLLKVEQWLHDDQKHGVCSGHTIYKHLKDTNELASCLNLQDGFAIKKKGHNVAHRLFAGNMVTLWGSVIQICCGDMYVPFLYGDYCDVAISWACLEDKIWNSNFPALCFAK